MNKRILRTTFAALVLSLFAIATASAQEVSSNARGTITSIDGTPVAGANVQISHVPSGSSRTAESNASGVFFQSGLRVGGPYTITVEAGGFRNWRMDNIYLKPGRQVPFDILLEPLSIEVEEIVVTGSATQVFDLNNGIGSAFTAEDISNTPTTSRDVIRTLLRDPFAQSSGSTGNLSVAGVNPRLNGLAIDGSLQQDDFGLSTSTYAGERPPINLDAIESATLVASDYDVTAGGFTGGLVNLTIKSGTNDWDGNIFYFSQNEDMVGTKYDGDRIRPKAPLDETEYGFTFGGPIIRDRLFFFLSYDEFESANNRDFSNADAANGIQPGFWEALRGQIDNILGYDPGPRPNTASTPEISERTLAKIDWNINDYHRASFTYQNSLEETTSVDDLIFESGWYDAPSELNAYGLQLFSDWTDNFATTLRINYKEWERLQNCRAGLGVGEIFIENISDADIPVGDPLDGLLVGSVDEIIGGCDRFRHANEYSDERLQVMAKADYFLGDHVITGGIEYEQFDLFNVFMSGGARGWWVFDDYTALLSDVASRVNYENATTNDARNAAAIWGYDKWSLFIQDSVSIGSNLELNFGLRYERFDQSDKPFFSQTIFDTYGLRSDTNLDGRDLLLPRFSFRWNATDRTTVTGGVGRFSGGDPKVWTSNAFSLPTVRASVFDYPNPDPTSIPPELPAQVALGNPVPIDVIAPDFKIPSDWKASLRVEQEFWDNYIFSAQYLYTRTSSGFLWQNRAQLDLAGVNQTGVAPDGRPIYANLDELNIDNLTMLTNFRGGRSHAFSVAVGKAWDNGVSAQFSYANQDVEAVTEGTSSRGVSNWRGIVTTDRNNPYPKPAPFQVEHSFKLNLGFEKDFFGTGLSATRIDLFARRVSGDVFSETFDVFGGNPMFGRASRESPFDTDLLYVPTGPSDPNVVFASGFDQGGFFEYVANAGLSPGIQIANTRTAAWNNIWDLRIQQSIPGFGFLGDAIGDNNFRIVLDIDNFLNLLNKDWGRFVNGPSFGQHNYIRADIVSAADVAANGVDGATALTGDLPRTTCVSQGDCVYRFNSTRSETTNFVSSFNSVYKIRLGIRFDF